MKNGRAHAGRVRVLIFHPALAPYRVDLFNMISSYCDLKVIFLQENVLSQSFDQKKLRAQCRFEFEFLPEGISLFGFYIRFGVSEKIKKIKPDIVVTHEFLGVSIQVCRIKKISNPSKWFIWTAENPMISEKHSFIRVLLKRFLLERADGLIAYSHESSSFFRKKYKFDNLINVLPNIPDSIQFRAELRRSTSVALSTINELNIASRKVVLFVGRLAKEKSLDKLMQAFVLAKEHDSNLVLVIVGSGELEKVLLDTVFDSNMSADVVFVGHKEGYELKSFFVMSSVLCLLSSYEPFGAVVNEALVAGVPVVCSENVGAKSLIDRGVNGSVVDPSSLVGVAKEINRWTSASITCDKLVTSNLRTNLLPLELGDAVREMVKDWVDQVRISY